MNVVDRYIFVQTVGGYFRLRNLVIWFVCVVCFKMHRFKLNMPIDRLMERTVFRMETGLFASLGDGEYLFSYHVFAIVGTSALICTPLISS